MKRLFLSVAVGCATLPAMAQDAETALAELQALAVTGSFDPEALPATALAADGCDITVTIRSVSPQLGVPVTASSTADARALFPAAFAPDPSDGRLTIWIPREDQGPIDLTMTLDTEDAAARTAFEGGLGADCSAAGPCSAVQATPRMPVSFYLADGDDGMDSARAFSTALSAFAETCVPAG